MPNTSPSLRTILHSVAAIASGDLAIMVAGLGFVVLWGRLADPEELGAWGFLLGLCSLAAPLIDQGWELSLLRDVAASKNQARTLVQRALRAKYMPAAAVIGATAALGAYFQPEPRHIALALALAAMPLRSFCLVVEPAMQALGYAPAAAAVKSASALLQTALMATSVLMGAGLEHVLAAQLAGEAVRSAWQWYRFAALTRHATPTDPHGDAKNANKEERAQLTLFVVLSALSTRLSLVWLAPAAGEAAAGFFSIAFRFMTAFRTIPGALLTSILPALGAGAHSRDSKNAMLWTLAASSVAAIACTLLAHPLVTFLWGPRYLPAAEALRILSLCFPALVISHAAEASLLAKQQQKTVTATTAASLLALVAANAAWLHLGTEAAAIIWTSWNWLLAAALAAAHYAHTKRHNTQTKK